MEKAVKNPWNAEETTARPNALARPNPLAQYSASLGSHGPGPPAWQYGGPPPAIPAWRMKGRGDMPLPHPG